MRTAALFLLPLSGLLVAGSFGQDIPTGTWQSISPEGSFACHGNRQMKIENDYLLLFSQSIEPVRLNVTFSQMEGGNLVAEAADTRETRVFTRRSENRLTVSRLAGAITCPYRRADPLNFNRGDAAQ